MLKLSNGSSSLACSVQNYAYIVMKRNLLSAFSLLLGILTCAGLATCRHKPSGEHTVTQQNTPQPREELTQLDTSWIMGPFVKQDSVNPVLQPRSNTTFYCPLRKSAVKWEEKDVFNPAAVVRNGKVHLLYRAEDVVGKYAGTSRLGLAISEDGLHFDRQPKPVFYPGNDFMKVYEWEGGCEDPRIVETADGRYVLTYTAYDGKTARLCVCGCFP